MKTLNIVTYLRVSTSEQDVSAQRIELAAYCARAGWTLDAEFSDVLSGGRAVRPGLDLLLERCAAGGVDAVVVVKLDRLGRSLLNVVGLVRRLADMGVAVVCSSQGIDTRASNPCGKMILSVMAAFAEFEKDIIRERTVAGLVAARARGSVLGRPSPTLVAEAARGPIVATWLAGGRVGGLRGLAVSLGGCSPNTASAVVNACAAVTALD
jgi:putative DNA-invertase from lambdoid prophage Rac